jgi:hypothetical protein
VCLCMHTIILSFDFGGTNTPNIDRTWRGAVQNLCMVLYIRAEYLAIIHPHIQPWRQQHSRDSEYGIKRPDSEIKTDVDVSESQRLIGGHYRG